MASPKFRKTDITRALRAAKAAGIERFDLSFDRFNRPVIRVRDGLGTVVEDDVLNELEAWVSAQVD